MKIIHKQNLPELPSNVKELVSDGVYGLFTVGGEDNEYALVLGQESTAYLLDSDGNINEVVMGEEYSNLDLAEAITFYDEESRATRINAA